MPRERTCALRLTSLLNEGYRFGHSRAGQEQSTMVEIKDRSGKKPYNRPQLVDHGDIDEVTQKTGHSVTDVPIGTPVDGDIGNVAS